MASVKASESLPSLFPPAPELLNLRHFEIGMATVSENVLLTFYDKHKSTLRGISLHKVTLTSSPKSNINLCARLCAKMAKLDFDLETFTLSHMKQHIRGGFSRTGELHFRSTSDPRIKVWRGSAFSQAIKDITNDMHPTWGDENSDENDGSTIPTPSFTTFLLRLTIFLEAESMADANEDSDSDSVEDDDEDDEDDDDD